MDKGPWTVDEDGTGQARYIDSGDFARDVTLRVYGDFADMDDRKAYCEWLAGVLNKAAEEAP